MCAMTRSGQDTDDWLSRLSCLNVNRDRLVARLIGDEAMKGCEDDIVLDAAHDRHRRLTLILKTSDILDLDALNELVSPTAKCLQKHHLPQNMKARFAPQCTVRTSIPYLYPLDANSRQIAAFCCPCRNCPLYGKVQLRNGFFGETVHLG